MRDRWNHHVAEVTERGYPVDSTDISVSMNVRGFFRVCWQASLGRVIVEVARFGEFGDMSMQLPVEKAILLRDLLDAGIADALAAEAAEPPAGGAA